jgi:hypothetical protein
MNEERKGWFKEQVTFGNIVVIVMFIGAIVSWQRTTETTNQVQDIRLSSIEKEQERASVTYQRRDMTDQQLATITQQLVTLTAKIDNITRAVR